jgi:hypothetical protein
MHRKRARYARAAVVFPGHSASRDARRVAVREVCWWCSPVGSVPPAREPVKLLRILRAGLAVGAAGRTLGKHRGGLRREHE